jgi:uncharacterized damage-inducible protein DinB
MIKKPINVNPDLYFASFIEMAKGDDLIESLKTSKQDIIDLIDGIDDEKSNHKYQEDKWTIKQVLKHICDSERVHTYRALRFSRKDKTDLPGFNENEYTSLDNSENLTLNQIRDEFISVRNATITFFTNMSFNAFDNIGTGNKIALTPRIIGWKISGHSSHHCNVIKERYLAN